MVFSSWAFSEPPIAKMVTATATDPQQFNDNYLKSTNRHKTPVPKTGPRKPIKGDDQWGYLTARDVEPPPKLEEFNANYLKLPPSKQIHIPVPRPYTIEKALAELKKSGKSQEAPEESDPVERAKIIRGTMEEGSEDYQYWSQIIMTLSQIANIKKKRSLTSDEAATESNILETIDNYEKNAGIEVPAAPASASPDVGSAAQIQAAVSALPSASAIAKEIRALFPSSSLFSPPSAPPPPKTPPPPPRVPQTPKTPPPPPRIKARNPPNMITLTSTQKQIQAFNDYYNLGVNTTRYNKRTVPVIAQEVLAAYYATLGSP